MKANIFKTFAKTIVTGFLCATVICGSVFSTDWNTDLFVPYTMQRYIGGGGKVSFYGYDARITENDKQILEILKQYIGTGNALAIYSENGELCVFVSGGNKQVANSVVSSIQGTLRDANPNIVPYGLVDIVSTINPQLMQFDIFDTQNNQVNMYSDFFNALKRYAEDVITEIRLDVYAQKSILTNQDDFVTSETGYNSFMSFVNIIIAQNEDIQSKMITFLSVLFNSPTFDYNRLMSALDDETKAAIQGYIEQYRLGLVWIKRAMHTEVQLQWWLRRGEIRIRLDRPILSACRPCESCASTAAVRHWCQDQSQTPFYCVLADGGKHENDNTLMIPFGILRNNPANGTVYLIALRK